MSLQDVLENVRGSATAEAESVNTSLADIGLPTMAAPHDTAAERFARQVRERPNHTALVAGDDRLSYAALDARVAHNAAVLSAAGFGAGSLIGVCLKRRASTIAAIHALARLGIVYVPLDPAHPPLRIASVARHAGLHAILVEDDDEAALARAFDDEAAGMEQDVPARPASLIAISTLSAPIADDRRSSTTSPAGDPHARATGDADHGSPSRDEALAYIIHTSGSTGRPKGVGIRHASLTNLIDAMVERLGLGPADIILGTASFVFDVSIPDIFLTLATGATLVLATEAEAPDGHALLELVRREGVTALQSTPSRLRLMLAAGWTPGTPSDAGTGALRIICGGEALAPALAEQLVARGVLWNAYGPTEATVWASARRVRHGADVAIGDPLAGYVLRVVDTDGGEIGTGEVGELLIGGVGVAALYVGQPALTEARFFRDDAGVRFYRTGDLVRSREDGCFDFLGRNDHQIKFNGIRIELGEIDAVLASHPSVGEALVMLRDPDGERPLLVAYVTGTLAEAGNGTPLVQPDPVAIEQFLAERLPVAMRPRIVVLDRFPLNTNGKIDRAALPAPRLRGVAAPAGGQAPVAGEPGEAGVSGSPGGAVASVDDAPCSPTERVLAAIWCQVLELDHVTRSADFLELGGDSLAATAVGAEIRRALDLHLGVATLVSITTLEALAAHVDGLIADGLAARSAAAHAEAPQIVSWNPEGPGTPIWGLHNLLPFRLLATCLGATHPFHAVALSRRAGHEMREGGSIEAIGRAYADAILARPHAGDAILIGWCAASTVSLDVARRLRAGGVAVKLIVLVDPEPTGLLAAAIRILARLRRIRLRDVLERRRASRADDRREDLEGTTSAHGVDRGTFGRRTWFGREKVEDEGFAWLERALLWHRQSGADAGDVLIAAPRERNAMVAAWRRRVWARTLPPGTRFVTLPGNHAAAFQAAGAASLAAAIEETLAAL